MAEDTIAIVGGGPAGSVAAESLARGGRRVILFEEKPGWEKPCGGGLTHRALMEWPFLNQRCQERNWAGHCELIAPSGRKASFGLEQPLAIFSRQVLNGLLLERARAAGAEIVARRVLGVEGWAGDWRLHASAGSYKASYVILATGARTAFRTPFAQPFAPEDLMITAGYYIPGQSGVVRIQFLAGLEGYVWLFPRADHYSAGICGKLTSQSSARLRATLEQSLTGFGMEFKGAPFYAHVLPSLRAETLRSRKICGEGWALIGDAAGFVDPITGEGLYYAMRSGELAAQALLAERPDSYAARVRKDFLPDLETAASVADRFYSGSWMGQAVIERMVQFTASSPSFRTLMCDMFAGTQGYSNLRRRLYRTLPAMLAEGLANALHLPSSGPGVGADSPAEQAQAAQ
ncbi:MAG TPA: NAD(P)/FAD-dependent oxidoreductase [Terriglobales bacterium]|nr:NAD(P)/FAD-dependent oxidoreductase [Terriglobales bacterium]